MEKPYIVDFGEGEERWQDAELGKKWTSWIQEELTKQEEQRKLNPRMTPFSRGYFAKEAAKKYNQELISGFLDQSPNTPSFESLDSEDEAGDEAFIRSKFKLNPTDPITPSHNNWMKAWRISQGLIEEDAEPSIFGSLDTRFNRKTLEENKAWEAARAKTPAEEYKPMVIQSTSPSRLQSLGVFGQQIDPNVPLFLQKANTHIPWGVNHPLRKLYRESVLKRGLDPDRDESEYKAMEELNNPNYLESDLYKGQDTSGEPWYHLKDLAADVRKFGYTPHLIHKMQTEKQKEMLKTYRESITNGE
jgi:hypothetical protein